jgi:hypothetical protein
MELHHLAEYPSAQLRVYFLTSPNLLVGHVVRRMGEHIDTAGASALGCP